MLGSSKDSGSKSLAIDVTAQTFEAEVIQRSRETLVVVDFWAAWCQPCRTLGPLLEEEVAKVAQHAVLVKVDVDAQPDLAAAFGVQSIPFVVAIKDGRMVSQFAGAQPREGVQSWLRQLVPTPEESALDQARRLLAAGQELEAERVLGAFLVDNPTDAPVLLELGKLHAGRGETDQAREVLARIPENLPEAEDAKRELLMMEMFAESAQAPALELLEKELAKHPSDLAVRFQLAGRYWLDGRVDEAFAALLEIVRRDRAWRDGSARRVLVALMGHLGERNESSERARAQLANILFS